MGSGVVESVCRAFCLQNDFSQSQLTCVKVYERHGAELLTPDWLCQSAFMFEKGGGLLGSEVLVAAGEIKSITIL